MIFRSKGFYNFVCRQSTLRLIFDMLNSNHQWKARFFFVQGVNWVCHSAKWNSIRSFYDHFWGLLNKSSESSRLSRSSVYISHLTNICPLFVSAIVCLTILPKQEAFLERVFEIPLEERPWKRLVNLDILHAFCGRPVPSEEAWRLDYISRVRKYFCSSLSFWSSLDLHTL